MSRRFSSDWNFIPNQFQKPNSPTPFYRYKDSLEKIEKDQKKEIEKLKQEMKVKDDKIEYQTKEIK